VDGCLAQGPIYLYRVAISVQYGKNTTPIEGVYLSAQGSWIRIPVLSFGSFQILQFY
jgi:hypothetical protein